MHAIQMTAEEIRRYVRSVMSRHLKNVPEIALPLPKPAARDARYNWTMDLAGVQTYGYGDLLGVIIAEAQQTAWLKAEAKESEVRLTPPPPAGIVKKPGRRRS